MSFCPIARILPLVFGGLELGMFDIHVLSRARKIQKGVTARSRSDEPHIFGHPAYQNRVT